MKNSFTVEYTISEENLKLLNEVHELFKKRTGSDNSIDFTFEFIMKLNSNNDIKQKLEFIKDNYSKIK